MVKKALFTSALIRDITQSLPIPSRHTPRLVYTDLNLPVSDQDSKSKYTEKDSALSSVMYAVMCKIKHSKISPCYMQLRPDVLLLTLAGME